MMRLTVFSVLALWVFSLMAQQAPVDPQRTLEQRVLVLERRVQTLSDLLRQIDRLQREVQQLRGELEVQNHTVDSMKQRQRDLYLDIDKRLGQMRPGGASGIDGEAGSGAVSPPAPVTASEAMPAPVAAPRGVPAPAPSAPPPASTAEERDYQHAFNLLTLRRYDEARKAFESFLNKYPGGQYADNAQYWLGETGYVTRDFDTALTDFTKLLKTYPDSPKVSGAMLKIGYIEYEKKQSVQARGTLETLIKRYPGSSAARLAQEFIRSKGL